MTTMTAAPATRDILTDCVRTATTAPSLHNSQPWLFRIRGSRIEMYADPTRRLDVVDPDGREQLISVGAAVFTLRLAIRRAGFGCDVDLLPDPDRPDLVARVAAMRPLPVSAGVEALAAAVPYRHTNRWPFATTRVPDDVLGRLQDAARREGTVLAVTRPPGRDAVLRLARSADHQLHERPGYRAELAAWAALEGRSDGVPLWALGVGDALNILPMRTFTEPARPRDRFEPSPVILVLATAGDTRAAWVRAGQALQRVLLTATWYDLATMPLSQPVEVPAIRRLLIDPGSGLSAQMVLRIGYGRTIGRTLRRPLTEVLLPNVRRTARRTSGPHTHDGMLR